jgi:hypothetical protein
MGLLASATARVLEGARAQLKRPVAWPDSASGFAYRLLKAAHLPLLPIFAEPQRPANPQILRRAPDLAAFGYVISETGPEVQADWAQAFDRLMGRDVFPSDRNSFIHNPLELMGITLGVAECPVATSMQRGWLAATIQRGFVDHQFVALTSQVAAACAEHLVNPGKKSDGGVPGGGHPLTDLDTGELLFLTALALLFPERAAIDVVAAEQEIISRVLLAGAPASDASEAAALYVVLNRVIERTALSAGSDYDPAAKVIALCRRFQLFLDRLQARQRQRPGYSVKDEYDVQDLLHAILKLHFEDVRPEEWTPSYAGNSSRMDFLLPRERTIIEAKMTRSGLGQKEVANELIIDVARYAKAPYVDNLVCFIYDPARLCTNPSALEDDLAHSGGHLKVTAVVCPRGT